MQVDFAIWSDNLNWRPSPQTSFQSPHKVSLLPARPPPAPLPNKLVLLSDIIFMTLFFTFTKMPPINVSVGWPSSEV